VRTFERLAGRPDGPRLVFLDYYAPASSPYFGVLPLVDRYLKRQVLRDRRAYLDGFAGGTMFTDYLTRSLGYDLEGWDFGSRPDPGSLQKLRVGWNFGATRRRQVLMGLSRWVPVPWERRPFALHMRIGSDRARNDCAWYHRYRSLGLEKLRPLARRYRCTGTERVSRKRFLGEMLLSRVVFSPFGWGEVCFRDFEAVCSGALLVKPSMSHLQTSPDIYVENETYVPVRWDLADLEEKVHRYLTHPDEARAIVERARRVLRRYFERDGFLNDVARCLLLDDLPRSHDS
jgi:hypothetical protein